MIDGYQRIIEDNIKYHKNLQQQGNNYDISIHNNIHINRSW